MRGLFLKDFYIMRQSVRTLLFILVLWGIVFLPREGGSAMVVTMFTMVGGINFMNLFSYDKQANWDAFMLSMPVMRKKAVVERYLFTLFMSVLASSVAVILVTAAGLIRQGFLSGELVEEIQLSWKLGLAAGYFYTAIALPSIYWLGVEKARLIPAVLMGAVFFGFVLLGGKEEGAVIMKLLMAFEGLGLVLLSLAAMAISCLISIQIYEKKEF